MNPDLLEALKKLRKTCYKVIPILAEINDKNYSQTRFGGVPYSESSAQPPVCSTCKAHLTYVFQFRQRFSEEMMGLGPLHVVYYCFDCLPIGGEGEDGQWKVVTWNKPHEVVPLPLKTYSDIQYKPCEGKVEVVNMLPCYETIEDHYPHIAAMCKSINELDPSDAYQEAGEAIGSHMEPFTSIGGYPLWIQGPAENICPLCKKKMPLMCQIDSEHKPGLAWGDAGCLYVFQCLEHLDKFAIEMQCF